MFELPDRDNIYYPVSDDRRKFMYPYGSTPTAGYGQSTNLFPMASSPRDIRMTDRASDSGTQSESKTTTPKRMTEDIQSFEDRDEASQMEVEKKKDEPKFDLLAGLDFDEPVVFNTTEEVGPSVNGHESQKDQKTDQVSQTENQMNEELLEDLPMEHEVANVDDITEMTDAAVSVVDQQIGGSVQNGSHSVYSEMKEFHDYTIEPEAFKEETKELNFLDEEINSVKTEQEQKEVKENKEEEKIETKGSDYRSLSRERVMEEEKKMPPKPPGELPKQPPPQIPYDTNMMRPTHDPMRSTYGMDHRPPPPPQQMMYPASTQQMRYPSYPGYSNAYPPAPYSSYPITPYPNMDPHMRQGMGMASNYPYPYYGYPPGMWGGNRQQFPYETKG